MSHHKSTPKSVLNAPTLTPVLVHPAHGLNRAERRHPETVASGRAKAAWRAKNTPFVGKVRVVVALQEAIPSMPKRLVRRLLRAAS